MAVRRLFVVAAACGVALWSMGALPTVVQAGDGRATAARGQGDDDSERIPLRFGLSGSTGAGGSGTNGGPRVQGSFRPADGARHLPEIDPSVVAGAIALVAGGLLILHDHRRRRRR
jgi:hypothetical protein